MIQLDYEALTKPAPGVRGLIHELRRLWRDVRSFRRVIRERRPELVLSVTTMLPAVPIAAKLERVPSLSTAASCSTAAIAAAWCGRWPVGRWPCSRRGSRR